MVKLTRKAAGSIACLTALVLGTTAVVSAHAQPNSVRTSAVAAASVKPVVNRVQDGRAVFAGVFFGQGRIGAELARSDSFSAMRGQLTQNNTAGALKTSGALMDAIEAKSPGFFANFGTRARSGDPRQVEAAMSAGQQQLQAVIKAHQSARVSPNGQDCGLWVAVGAAFVHVAAVVTAAGAAVTVTLAVAANVVKAKNWVFNVAADDSGALARDESVAKVTQLLATAGR